MTTTDTEEYRKLELDSSNDIIRHDARRSDRKYAEAALHAREAGLARVRMGILMRDAGEFTRAAEDWLSAAACFYLATDPARMREALDRVRVLNREGKIPPERRDLHEALTEREEQLEALDLKLSRFGQDFGRVTGQDALDWSLGQVRNLPGFPNLYLAIAHTALRLGQLPRAFDHLAWAEKFAPGNPQLAEFRVRLIIASGDSRRGIEMGRKLLDANPNLDHLRVLLAQASASLPDALRSDREEAIEMLRPLTEVNSADAHGRLLALALATILQHGLGHEAEYPRLLSSFDRLALTIQSPVLSDAASKIRRAFPEVFPKSGSNGVVPSGNISRQPSATLDSSAVRQFGELFNLSAA